MSEIHNTVVQVPYLCRNLMIAIIISVSFLSVYFLLLCVESMYSSLTKSSIKSKKVLKNPHLFKECTLCNECITFSLIFCNELYMHYYPNCIFRKIAASFVSARSSLPVNGRLDSLCVINLPQNRLPPLLINCCWFTFPCETYNLKSRFFPSNLSSIPLSWILPGNFRNYLPPNGSPRYVKTYGEIIFCSFTALEGDIDINADMGRVMTCGNSLLSARSPLNKLIYNT